MNRPIKKFKVITFKVYFNKYNYDRAYLAGIYNLLNKKTDYLEMTKIKTFLPNNSSVFNCIGFYLSAPERKIQKLYKKIVKYIQDESKYMNDLIEQMAKTDLIYHDTIFSNTKPPEIADVCMPQHIWKKHYLTGRQKYIVPKLFKTKKSLVKSPKKSSPKILIKSPKRTPSRSPKSPARSPKRTLKSPSRSPKSLPRSPKKSSKSPIRSPSRTLKSPSRSPKRAPKILIRTPKTSPKKAPKILIKSPSKSSKRSLKSPSKSRSRSPSRSPKR